MHHLFLALLAASLPVTLAEFVAERVQLASTKIASEVSVPEASFVVPIASVPRSSQKKKLLTSLRNHARTKSSPVAELAGSDLDEEYLTNVTVGGQHFSLIVDTGSSDTWLAQEGFKCYNLTSYPEPSSTCAFGTSGFSTSSSPTFEVLPNKNFNISYGDGEFLTGSVGFDTVTVGGLSVEKQEIGIVTDAAWEGDGINTGLLGLAYPGLTSVYEGSDPTGDSDNNSAPYDPFFFSAVSEGKVLNPYFSVALNRGTFKAQSSSNYDPKLGYLAFGGIAPVAVQYPSVTVPVQGYAVSSGSNYFYYTVDVQSYNFPGSSSLVTANNDTILDSGTTLNYVPTDIASAYNSEFIPPATFVEDEDTYYVDCNAIVPPFSVTLGGKTFSIDGRDQILPIGETDEYGKEICISGTQDGGAVEDGNIYILGDVFLHNAVATFNIQSNQITLDQRAPY